MVSIISRPQTATALTLANCIDCNRIGQLHLHFCALQTRHYNVFAVYSLYVYLLYV